MRSTPDVTPDRAATWMRRRRWVEIEHTVSAIGAQFADPGLGIDLRHVSDQRIDSILGEWCSTYTHTRPCCASNIAKSAILNA